MQRTRALEHGWGNGCVNLGKCFLQVQNAEIDGRKVGQIADHAIVFCKRLPGSIAGRLGCWRVHAAAAALLAHYAETADPDYGRRSKPHETYRQEYIRCGKAGCKRCADGQGHGPYWYAYSREGGKLKKRYIGKERT